MRALAEMGVVLPCLAALLWALPSVADFDLNTAVGIWHMDEGEGDMAIDSSPSGDHGKLWKDPQWVDGRFGKALEFNGENFVWMRTATGVPEGNSPRTLMAHFKWAEINEFADPQFQITDAEVFLATGRHNWGQHVSIQISADLGPGGGLGTDIYDDRLMYEWDADTEWHHLAGVFPDGAENADEFLIYFDGVLQEELIYEEGQDDNPQPVNTVGGEIAIACWTGGPINYFKGILDVSPQAKLATSWGVLKSH